MTDRYCEEHPRVELEKGKCIACGEVKYEVKDDISINMQVAYVTVFIMIGIVIFAVLSILNS